MFAAICATESPRTKCIRVKSDAPLASISQLIAAVVVLLTAFITVTVNQRSHLSQPAGSATRTSITGFEQGVFRIPSQDNGLRCNPLMVNELAECRGVPLGATECHSGPGQRSQIGVTFPPRDLFRDPRNRTSRRYARRDKAGGKRVCIYARYSSRYQHSVEDQIRHCREWCAANGFEVDDVMIFCDRQTSGRHRSREGLDAMKQAIIDDNVDIVVVFATSRLYRRSREALIFADDFIVDPGKRVVFTSQGIDSADAYNWKLVLSIHAAIDEQQSRTQAAHVRAGQEGKLIQQMVHGTIPFGYTGVVVEGVFTRRQKPARRIEIDEDVRLTVMQIFVGFTHDKLTYKAIARRLKAMNVPPPPKVARWTRNAVRHLLTNRRYVGDWSYGRRESQWCSRLDNVRQVLREKPLRIHFIESLRIVPDDLFEAAQERIKSLQHGERTGRWREDAQGEPLIDPLHKLLWCAKHQRYLVPGGTHGKSWICLECKKADTPEERHLYSQLRRDLALKMVTEAVVSALRIDEATAEAIVDKATFHLEDVLTRPSVDVTSINADIKRLQVAIEFVYDTLGDAPEDRENARPRIEKMRKEVADLKAKKDAVEAAHATPPQMPSVERVRAEGERRASLILTTVNSAVAADRRAANDLLRQLVGGKISLEQVGERSPKRGHLRGVFTPALTALVGGVSVRADDSTAPVAIDFIAATKLDRDAEAVGNMLDEHPEMNLTQIGAVLGLKKAAVTKAVKVLYASRGEPVPDMKRRGQLLKNAATPPLYIRIAKRVGKLYTAGKLLGEIAEAVDSNRTTVEKSLRYWCDQNGIEHIDGRARRKQLGRDPRPDVS